MESIFFRSKDDGTTNGAPAPFNDKSFDNIKARNQTPSTLAHNLQQYQMFSQTKNTRDSLFLSNPMRGSIMPQRDSNLSDPSLNFKNAPSNISQLINPVLFDPELSIS